MERASKYNVKSLTPGWCLVGLLSCAPIVFFAAIRVVPAAADLMALIDKYPSILADPRTWSLLASLVLCSTQALLCGILGQAFKKRVLAAIYEGE